MPPALRGPDYDLLIDHELVGIRWRCATLDAASTLYPRLVAHAEALSVELSIAVIIGPDCPPPAPQARDALLRGHDRLFPHCRDLCLVVLGDGLRQQVLRRVITGMTLVAALRGRPFQHCRRLEDLLEAIAATSSREPSSILAQLLGAGLLSPDELGELQASSTPS
jgi:hypothetical protein